MFGSPLFRECFLFLGFLCFDDSTSWVPTYLERSYWEGLCEIIRG